MIYIKLEPRDIARFKTFESNKCKKCNNQFYEGDIVLRIGARPPKYYHKECFRPY